MIPEKISLHVREYFVNIDSSAKVYLKNAATQCM